MAFKPIRNLRLNASKFPTLAGKTLSMLLLGALSVSVSGIYTQISAQTPSPSPSLRPSPSPSLRPSPSPSLRPSPSPSSRPSPSPSLRPSPSPSSRPSPSPSPSLADQVRGEWSIPLNQFIRERDSVLFFDIDNKKLYYFASGGEAQCSWDFGIDRENIIYVWGANRDSRRTLLEATILEATIDQQGYLNLSIVENNLQCPALSEWGGFNYTLILVRPTR